MTQGPADGNPRGHFSPPFPLTTRESEGQAGEVVSTKVVNPGGLEGGFFAFCSPFFCLVILFFLPKADSKCSEVESTAAKCCFDIKKKSN